MIENFWIGRNTRSKGVDTLTALMTSALEAPLMEIRASLTKMRQKRSAIFLTVTLSLCTFHGCFFVPCSRFDVLISSPTPDIRLKRSCNAKEVSILMTSSSMAELPWLPWKTMTFIYCVNCHSVIPWHHLLDSKIATWERKRFAWNTLAFFEILNQCAQMSLKHNFQRNNSSKDFLSSIPRKNCFMWEISAKCQVFLTIERERFDERLRFVLLLHIMQEIYFLSFRASSSVHRQTKHFHEYIFPLPDEKFDEKK